jgi:AraC-like DNA-binding protein
MTETFLLGIAVESRISNSSDPEARQCSTLRFSLLPPNSASGNAAPLSVCTIDFLTEKPESVGSPVTRTHAAENRSVLAELFLQAYQKFSQMNDASLLAIERPLLRLGAANQAEIGVRAWLEAARKILESEFCDQPKLPEIAARVGVHPVHLAREFRKQYGSSVGEYLRKVRIEFACHRLLSSDDPPVKIATAAGFVDQSHFSRTFKRLIGTTPGRYRALLKRNPCLDQTQMRASDLPGCVKTGTIVHPLAERHEELSLHRVRTPFPTMSTRIGECSDVPGLKRYCT